MLFILHVYFSSVRVVSIEVVISISASDFCGEKLAWLFGITSPKYQYALDEAERLKEEVSILFLIFGLFLYTTILTLSLSE